MKTVTQFRIDATAAAKTSRDAQATTPRGFTIRSAADADLLAHLQRVVEEHGSARVIVGAPNLNHLQRRLYADAGQRAEKKAQAL